MLPLAAPDHDGWDLYVVSQRLRWLRHEPTDNRWSNPLPPLQTLLDRHWPCIADMPEVVDRGTPGCFGWDASMHALCARGRASRVEPSQTVLCGIRSPRPRPTGGRGAASSIHAQFRLPVLNASAINTLVAWVGDVLSEYVQDTQPLAEQDQITAVDPSCGGVGGVDLLAPGDPTTPSHRECPPRDPATEARRAAVVPDDAGGRRSAAATPPPHRRPAHPLVVPRDRAPAPGPVSTQHPAGVFPPVPACRRRGSTGGTGRTVRIGPTAGANPTTWLYWMSLEADSMVDEALRSPLFQASGPLGRPGVRLR